MSFLITSRNVPNTLSHGWQHDDSAIQAELPLWRHRVSLRLLGTTDLL